MKYMNGKILGVAAGILAAISYGMNPLFALPLYSEGFSVDAVLLTRYLVATAILIPCVQLRKEPYRIPLKQFLFTIPEGLLFAASSMCLYMSYKTMDAGIASTLLFVYPLITVLLMFFCFKEKLHWLTLLSLLLTMVGIALLYRTSTGAALSTRGIMLVMGSALTYAVYLIMINKTPLKNIPPFTLTLYIMSFAMLFFLTRLLCGCGKFGVFTTKALLNMLLIGIVPTMFSMFMTSYAVQKVGASVTSILGAMEPATAVFIGVLVFNEKLSVRIVCGIVLILSSVILTMIRKDKKDLN